MSKVTEFYAFVMEDKAPGDEGIIELQSQRGNDNSFFWLPLATHDRTAIAKLALFAQGLSRQEGKKVTLVRFTKRQDIRSIK